MKSPLRGEVWNIEFEPAIGAEIRKLRPGVVISLSDVGHLPLRMVVPITEWKDWHTTHEWFELIVPSKQNGLKKVSAADAFQCKSISVDRFIRKIGKLPEEQIENIVERVIYCLK